VLRVVVPVVPVGAGVNWNTRPRTASNPFGTFAIHSCSTVDASLAAMFGSNTSVGTVGKCSSLAPGPASAHTHDSPVRLANTRAYAISGVAAVVVAVHPSGVAYGDSVCTTGSSGSYTTLELPLLRTHASFAHVAVQCSVPAGDTVIGYRAQLTP
jgi:hypothetical protein